MEHPSLHKRTAHFLSFHFALPERVVLENGGTQFIPLQLGAYWVGAQGSPGRYQVVERSCSALPFCCVRRSAGVEKARRNDSTEAPSFHPATGEADTSISQDMRIGLDVLCHCGGLKVSSVCGSSTIVFCVQTDHVCVSNPRHTMAASTRSCPQRERQGHNRHSYVKSAPSRFF